MKKTLRVLAVTGLTVATAASLASCNKKPGWTLTELDLTVSPLSEEELAKKYGTKGSTLNIDIDYGAGSKKSGVTFQGTTGNFWYGTQTTGDLLPTWKAFGEKLNVTIVDGSQYKNKLATTWDGYNQSGYKDSNGNLLDLVMGNSSTISTAAEAGNLVSVTDAIKDGLMPNFYTWLKENDKTGSIYNSMKSNDDKIYFTPYFDGLNSPECMNLMNIEWVEKLLDATDAKYDTSTTISTNYNATISSMKNEKITVANSSDTDKATGTTEVKVTFTESVITKQNNLSTKDGKNLVDTLKSYLIATYGDYIAKSAGGKANDDTAIYKKVSEIYTSVAACYNVDELVALLRAVKANPLYLTNNAHTSVETLAPRTAQGNRQKQILQMASWWGARGVAGESGNLYFNNEGQLVDGRTQDATYEGITHLNELYKEGLIKATYDTDPSGKELGSTEFRSTYLKDGSIFMLYDYNATTVGYNANCTGNADGVSVEAVLPPVTTYGEKLTYGGETENTYFHFSEDNRALKSGGWSIPATSDNKRAAIELMDYMFSDEGADLQDYGPNNTNYRAAVTQYKDVEYTYGDYKTTVSRRVENNGVGTIKVGDQVCVKIADVVLENVGTKAYGGLGWNDFYRAYIGSTQGIGHVRSDGLDYQCTKDAGRTGLNALQKAISLGAMRLCQTVTDGDTSPFFRSVPTTYALTETEQNAINANEAAKNLETFFKAESATTPVYSKVIMNGWTSVDSKYQLATIKSTYASVDSVYQTAYRAAYARNNA